MNRYFFHSAVFRLAAPAVYGLILYLLILLINNNVSQINDLFVSGELYVCVVLTYLSFEVIRGTILIVNRALKKTPEGILILTQFVITIIISVALVLVCLMTYFHYVIGFSISSTQLIIFATVFTVTAVLYNVLYFSNYYLNKENTLRINAEKQQRTVLEMEMTEYKNAINPDLLYESLENVIALMYRDVEKCEEYIDCLGSAYRYVLTNRQNELVTIQSEWEAAKNIVRLLNEQYGGQLILKSDLDKNDLNAMLIPGSLPIILESLVRNTIITRWEPFVINCYREDDYLTIESKLNDRLILHDPSEDAFSRLQRSYSLFTDQPLIKVKAYEQNYIKLPVIRVSEQIEIA
jgi:sensor histidine kinase YesM